MESRNPNAAQLTRIRTQLPSTGLLVRLGGCLILAGLMAGVFLVGSTASSLERSLNVAPGQQSVGVSSRFGNSKGLSTILRVAGNESLLPVPTPTPVMVATFASDGTNCTTTPKTTFNLADNTPGAKIVCATVTDAQSGWRLIWSNANFVAVQDNAI